MKILHIGICVYGRPEGIEKAFMSVATKYKGVRPENATLNLLNEDYDLCFIQVQSDQNNETLAQICQELQRRGTKVVHWNGDIRHTTPEWCYTMAPYCITAFSNYRDVANVKKSGYDARFLQVGIDKEVFTPNGYSEPSAGEIVFLANRAPHFPNDSLRLSLVRTLKSKYQNRFKVYGNGWGAHGDGECNVKNPIQNVNMWQKKEAAIYRGCKVAISMSSFTEPGYTSDRAFRAMGSGALTLVHDFPYRKETLGEVNVFSNLSELVGLIEDIDLLNPLDKAEWVHSNHTYDHMVQNIINL